MEAQISEQQAAAYLGLTTRTLRNYRRTGKLAYREVRGKTRSTIEYLRSDLELLKNELTARRTRCHKPKTHSARGTRLSFEMPLPELDELRRDAEKCGLSANEYARRLIRDRLESTYMVQSDELRAELRQCLVDVRKIRSEFAAGFEAVLEYIGVSVADAKKWVNENLR
jgi:hypothetical protein